MAGTLVIDTLKASSGVLATQNGMTGIAKAWISWNPTSQTTIASFNVTSITYLTTSRYQLNFTTAMPSASYSVATCASDTPTIGTLLVVDGSQLPTASAVTLYTNTPSRLYFSAVIFAS